MCSASGLGEATVRELVARGANVAVSITGSMDTVHAN